MFFPAPTRLVFAMLQYQFPVLVYSQYAKGRIIILIHQQTQVGHHVLNFSTGEKDVPPEILYGIRFCISTFLIDGIDDYCDTKSHNP